MTIEEYIEFGNRVWAALKPGSSVPLSTNTMASILSGDDKGSLDKAYADLKKLAKSNFPAVTQGPEQTKKSFGVMRKVRPFLWQRPVDGDLAMAAWVAKIADTSLAGPYAAIEKRLAVLEASVKELENRAS